MKSGFKCKKFHLRPFNGQTASNWKTSHQQQKNSSESSLRFLNCGRKKLSSHSCQLNIMHKSRPGQVREILSFGQTKERESKKNLFQIFSLFTRISFDQNINFADENWVTFHFMQLDNVFMLFNNCQKRISLGSPSPFYLGSDSHLMTLSKWFSKKKTSFVGWRKMHQKHFIWISQSMRLTWRSWV